MKISGTIVALIMCASLVRGSRRPPRFRPPRFTNAAHSRSQPVASTSGERSPLQSSPNASGGDSPPQRLAKADESAPQHPLMETAPQQPRTTRNTATHQPLMSLDDTTPLERRNKIREEIVMNFAPRHQRLYNGTTVGDMINYEKNAKEERVGHHRQAHRDDNEGKGAHRETYRRPEPSSRRRPKTKTRRLPPQTIEEDDPSRLISAPPKTWEGYTVSEPYDKTWYNRDNNRVSAPRRMIRNYGIDPNAWRSIENSSVSSSPVEAKVDLDGEMDEILARRLGPSLQLGGAGN